MIHAVTSVLRVPLAIILVRRGMGGLAWAIAITCAARCGVMAWWFARGAWKRRRLAVAPEAEVAYAPGT